MSQANDSNFIDPRSQINHALDEGQVYEDTRVGREMILVFLSDEAALLKDGDSHRLENRVQFEKNVGGNRYQLQQDTDGSFTSSAKIKKLKKLLDQYDEQDGRKAKHKVEALDEAVTMLENNGLPDDNETVQFEDIDGVGQKTADSLRARGYRLKKDIRAASDEELLEVSGVGRGNLENIRGEVE